MKCLNCGSDTKNFLCNNCITEPILDEVFNIIKSYKPETCNKEFICEYAKAFEVPYEVRACIPDILKLFDSSIAEYYYIRYFRILRDERFEEAALHYLFSNSEMDIKYQTVLNDLLDSYLRNDFIKPQKWCNMIAKTENLCCELYYNAAQFFAMTGDYDIANKVINMALAYCKDDSYHQFLLYSKEQEIDSLTKLYDTNQKYKTKRPYWPLTEERRRLVAAIYDEKGIVHPRIESKPTKIKESDFNPIKETIENVHTDYCTFWCAEIFSTTAIKSFYQIAAVKVRDGVPVDEFQSHVRAWGGDSAKKMAKAAGIDADILNAQEDIDQVMKRFFDFVGNDVLLSTEALGNQAKLISRAARYSSMKEIPNLFFDLLDYAADISDKFDMENNTRDYLIGYFNLHEGKDSLEKAKRNVDIYTHLMEMDS